MAFSLPKEHVTAKLESLPKGLRLQAEAIIKKRFGLVVEKNKPAIDPVEYHDQYPMITRSTVKYIKYDLNRDQFLASDNCLGCGREIRFDIDKSAIQNFSEYHHQIACRCGQCTRFDLSINYLRDVWKNHSYYNGGNPNWSNPLF